MILFLLIESDENTMKKQLPYALQISVAVINRFFQEKYTYRASALSFTTLLALVPLLLVVVFFTSIFPIFTRLVALTQDYIFSNFIPTSSSVIQTYLEGFVQKAHNLPAIGIVFLFFTAGMLINTIVHTLNDIWRVPKRKKNIVPWVLYWLALILMPLLIGLTLFLSSYLFSLTWLSSAVDGLGFTFYLLGLFPLVMNTAIFTALYIIVPNCRVTQRDGFVGGLVAALLFEIAKKGFAFYIIYFPSYELIYGVLATIPIFLLWLYISWMIILIGALVSHTRYQLRQKTAG
jgi:membrane protein